MRYPLIALFCGVLLLARLNPDNISQAQDKKPPAEKKVDGDAVSVAAVRPLLQKYCFECHSQEKMKGDVDLESISADATAAVEALDVWNLAAAMLRKQEMPPKKKPQPSNEEREKLLAFVKAVDMAQIDCTKIGSEEVQKVYGTRPMTRRLSRTEYNNTVRDLLGVDFRLEEFLPSDGSGGEGFDNAGSTLFTTELHVEKYLESAELVLDTILPAKGAVAKLEKPVDPTQLETARKKLLAVQPSAKLDARAAAKKTLESLLPRAFRRPVTAAEIDRFLTLFDRGLKRGDPYDQCLKLALKGVLISPHFLFLVEPEPAKAGSYRLGHYQVAARLSYFLWVSMPDEELFKLAADNKLHDPEVLRNQVRRMMKDPRSRGFADSFATQWLGLRALGGSVRPDPKSFPKFDEALAEFMRLETVLFFDHIFRENRSVLELLDADYTFLNGPLAQHYYDSKDVKDLDWKKVKLQDRRRGGILGHASILTVTSYPLRTSPVLRGRWLLDEILGAKVPPPPPDVPELPGGKGKNQKLTMRQQLEVHRTKAECASCHNRMDPLGFALENFDPVGRWRDKDAGKPIDTSGVLPSGEKFKDLAEFKQLLLGKLRQDFLRNISRKLLGYALTRELNRADMCVVEECVRQLENGKFQALHVLDTIVQSYAFGYRYR
ncbi:MAG TPA: DUF1592 domain-containing protein [Gemmataceae bacterium]|nr:DUF1592 domain-containing protein [Gemmataceae bacterium]